MRRTRPTPPASSASKAIALACICLGLAGTAFAQMAENPDWEESEAPPPPAYQESRLIDIEMPPYVNLRFSIDPGTITITGDGVVRYVVVARSRRQGDATNAFYEGIRCATGEIKTYARSNAGAWDLVENAEWKRIRDMKSSYAQAISSQAVCRGRAPRASVGDMVDQLRNPIKEVQ